MKRVAAIGARREHPRLGHTALARTMLGFAVLGCVTFGLLAGCGDSDPDDSGSGSPSSGEELYQQRCSNCHGSDLRGTPAGPSQLSIIYEPGHHPDEAYRSAVENGAKAHHWEFGDMPPINGLSSAEVDEIIAYIREVQKREGLEE